MTQRQMRPRDVHNIYTSKALFDHKKKKKIPHFSVLFFSSLSDWDTQVATGLIWCWCLIIHHAEDGPKEDTLTAHKQVCFLLLLHSLTRQSQLRALESVENVQSLKKKAEMQSPAHQQKQKDLVHNWLTWSVSLERQERVGELQQRDVKRTARLHAGPPAHLPGVPLLRCSFWNKTDRKKTVWVWGLKEHYW